MSIPGARSIGVEQGPRCGEKPKEPATPKEKAKYYLCQALNSKATVLDLANKVAKLKLLYELKQFILSGADVDDLTQDQLEAYEELLLEPRFRWRGELETTMQCMAIAMRLFRKSDTVQNLIKQAKGNLSFDLQAEINSLVEALAAVQLEVIEEYSEGDDEHKNKMKQVADSQDVFFDGPSFIDECIESSIFYKGTTYKSAQNFNRLVAASEKTLFWRTEYFEFFLGSFGTSFFEEVNYANRAERAEILDALVYATDFYQDVFESNQEVEEFWQQYFLDGACDPAKELLTTLSQVENKGKLLSVFNKSLDGLKDPEKKQRILSHLFGLFMELEQAQQFIFLKALFDFDSGLSTPFIEQVFSQGNKKTFLRLAYNGYYKKASRQERMPFLELYQQDEWMTQMLLKHEHDQENFSLSEELRWSGLNIVPDKYSLFAASKDEGGDGPAYHEPMSFSIKEASMEKGKRPKGLFACINFTYSARSNDKKASFILRDSKGFKLEHKYKENGTLTVFIPFDEVPEEFNLEVWQGDHLAEAEITSLRLVYEEPPNPECLEQ